MTRFLLVGERRDSNPQGCEAEETRSVFQHSTQGAKRRSGPRPHAPLQSKRPFPCGNDFDNAVLRFDLGRLAQRDDFCVFDPSF